MDAGAGNWGGVVVVVVVRNGARLVDSGEEREKRTSERAGSRKARCSCSCGPSVWREHVGDDEGLWFAVAQARRPTRKANR